MKQELREATINGTVPSEIVDTGASSTCVQPAEQQIHESECGDFQWKNPPFKTTGMRPRKIFQMALGNLAPAEKIVRLSLPLREEALEAHTVKGAKHNLLSVNKLAASGY